MSIYVYTKCLTAIVLGWNSTRICIKGPVNWDLGSWGPKNKKTRMIENMGDKGTKTCIYSIRIVKRPLSVVWIWPTDLKKKWVVLDRWQWMMWDRGHQIKGLICERFECVKCWQTKYNSTKVATISQQQSFDSSGPMCSTAWAKHQRG